MTKILHSFLDKHFEGMNLRPALFYSWEYSTHFEISDPLILYYEKKHLKQAFHQSITLFDKVFGEEDEIIFVTDVHSTSDNLFLQRRPLKLLP
ncbi:hypothetical protein SFC34_26345 [Priestia aryabhattai]|uniref:DUF3885 domain-containing protein n=1 Tax=Priestia aryabhattai TaxID=412384 RepID=UPI003981F958